MKYLFYTTMVWFILNNQTASAQSKDDLRLIPYPHIAQQKEQSESSSGKNRFLIIDCNPDIYAKKNTTLYRKQNKKMRTAYCLPRGGSFSVLIENYTTTSLHNIVLRIDNEIYFYKYDFKKLYTDVKGSESESNNNIYGKFDEEIVDSDLLMAYLDTVYKNINKEYLNLDDFLEVQEYKDTLLKSIYSQDYKLSDNEQVLVNKIVNYYPTSLSLTTFPILVADVDAVSISIEGQDTSLAKMPLAKYEVSQSLAVGINTNIYLTGLTSSNDLYFEGDSSSERFVRLDNPNKSVMGLGVNAEVAYLTGVMLKPTMNFGFMLPIGQENLSPYFTFGPGVSLGTSRVKLSFSGGWAMGKVNQIKKRYQDVDLNTLNEEAAVYTEMAWKKSWQISIGLSFNLPTNI